MGQQLLTKALVYTAVGGTWLLCQRNIANVQLHRANLRIIIRVYKMAENYLWDTIYDLIETYLRTILGGKV